jgi:hypothetical protein
VEIASMVSMRCCMCSSVIYSIMAEIPGSGIRDPVQFVPLQRCGVRPGSLVHPSFRSCLMHSASALIEAFLYAAYEIPQSFCRSGDGQEERERSLFIFTPRAYSCAARRACEQRSSVSMVGDTYEAIGHRSWLS